MVGCNFDNHNSKGIARFVRPIRIILFMAMAGISDARNPMGMSRFL